MEPKWVDKRALLLLHEESLAQFGGASGVRDAGLLDSALARPRNLFSYAPDTTLDAYAASYAYGLAKNHAFVDGNKRVAFLAIGVFLFINGYRLTASQVDAIETILGVASGAVSESDLAQWIASNMQKR